MRYRTLRGTVAGAAALLLLIPAVVAAQDAVITGRLQSQSLTPAAGAIVSIPALNVSTVSNDLGVYRLVVPAAQARGQEVTLNVTLIGYDAQNATLTLTPGNHRRDFTLQERAIALDEIVVTGTAGQLERRAQSAVIASVNASKISDVAPVTQVSDLLQSRVPGVSLQGASGTSGTAQTIRIRGAASISLSNEPLVFIDGVRADARNSQIYGTGGQSGSRLNDIPPEDIESIEIVKGPAAATLYGADASAGVIQIITKKGRTGSRFAQNLTVEYHSIDANWTPPSNWAACSSSATTRNTDKNGNPITEADNPCLGKAPGTIVSDNPLQRTGAFRDGQLVSLNWSGRGGGDAYNYYVSLTSDREDGTLPNNYYSRHGGQFSVNFNPSPVLRIEGAMGVTKTLTELPQNDNNIYGFLGGGLLGSPNSRGTPNDGWYARNRQVQALTAIENDNSTIRTRPRLTATYTPFSWFNNTVTVGADMTRTEAKSFFPRNDSSWYGTNDLNSGQISQARQHYDVVTLDYRGNVSRQLASAFRTDISFGAQYIGERNDLTNATGTGLITNAANAINAAARNTGGQSYSEEKTIGGYGQAQLTAFDRLYLTLSGRLDRHSAFGSEADMFFSPRVGVSYVASEEPAIRSFLPSVISTLRLRTVWGTTGRSPSSGALRTYDAAPFLIAPSTVGSGVVPDNPGNAQLKPERGEEIELGADIGLLNERLGLEATYFKKTSKDLVLRRPLPPSMGFDSNPFVNIGELVNEGFELAANAQVLNLDHVGLDLRLALNTLRNEVLDLGDVAPFGTMNRVEKGMQAYAFVTRKIIRYDFDANRAIVTDEPEFVGNLLPDFEGNFSGTLTLLRNIRLYGQLDWKQNFYIYNNTDQFRERQFGQGERWVRRDSILSQQERLRRFGPFFTEGGQAVSNGNVNEAYIQPGDFVRLREVSATFSLPRSIAQTFLSQSASITLGARNLALWTDYEGADPEVNSSTSGTTRSEFLTVPQPRRYVARVNLQF